MEKKKQYVVHYKLNEQRLHFLMLSPPGNHSLEDYFIVKRHVI